MAWWDGSEILGGRDELAGGTWLACSRTGRVAFLTNVLELHTLPEAKSRGDLPVLFLEVSSSSSILQCFLYFFNLNFCSSYLTNIAADYEESDGICRGAGDRGASVQWI